MKQENNDKRVFIDPEEYERVLATIFLNISNDELEKYCISSRLLTTSRGKTIELVAIKIFNIEDIK